MNDRELLELAAKAAGGELLKTSDGYPYWAAFKDTPAGPWNPLEDDGEALRLAVQLTIHLKLCTRTIIAEWSNTEPDILESRGSDACAATRRAIVKSAAERGKSVL